jgi:Kdo2-lipid IVA lauroyltransferase/acyltransferase
LIPGVPSIFVGAHLSNWEIAGTGLARHLGGLNTIYSPIGIPEIDKLLVAFRGESGANYLERNLASIKTVYAGMEAGRGVALLIDRRIDNGEPVNFFGRATTTTSLPAKLAIRFNAPIIPVDAVRVTARHFVVTLFPPIMAKDFPGPEPVKAMTQAVMDAIERSIRRSPDTWFCGQTRWKNAKVKEPAMEPA